MEQVLSERDSRRPCPVDEAVCWMAISCQGRPASCWQAVA